MRPWLVTWIGGFPSTVDGRVIQVTQTEGFNDKPSAEARALELAANPVNVQVTIYQLHEALPYRCERLATGVDL